MKVLAYRRWDSDRCPRCGTFPADWLDERGRVKLDPPHGARRVKCYGCQEIHEIQQDLGDDPTVRVVMGPPLHPDERAAWR